MTQYLGIWIATKTQLINGRVRIQGCESRAPMLHHQSRSGAMETYWLKESNLPCKGMWKVELPCQPITNRGWEKAGKSFSKFITSKVSIMSSSINHYILCPEMGQKLENSYSFLAISPHEIWCVPIFSIHCLILLKSLPVQTPWLEESPEHYSCSSNSLSSTWYNLLLLKRPLCS